MYAETLQSLCEQSGGILLTKDIVNAGVPSSYLTAFLREGKLERVGHGVYITPDVLEDKMFTLQARKKRLIYSHDTALYLHDLTDRDPLTYSVTVPTGYNTKRLTEEGLSVFSIKPDLYGMGITTAQSPFGRPIRAYDAERALCDMLRSRHQMDGALFPEALKRYVRRKNKNIPLLMRYAESLHVNKLLRQYLEVLL
ncbi:type IV toxin-antitoxin system AbiEi family antitoxin domain-containing protein [Caproicibacter fermentans]|uniref:Type IV toxin-antitoxin system AbiEi family antitoxin domain-containing protein n=1 Tax=Caproicibacter fermentans TaxID=2576756 RepID=A0A7G8T8G3_9FIRM|nr:type IV toxin-antitoxin system AbiEi family antitoxin domain-containing protein [Caproicibacter fermentans]QNK39904.1 type IV toxin-antitoxin system AbiEi family antitoxin domain-containing protein [Caproicibacter fermentans]